MAGVRFRFIWPVALISLCLVALCAFTASYLLREQQLVAGVLRENVDRRRAAGEVAESLDALVGPETAQAVGVLGGFAGLVLGYGVSRGLTRSLRRLHVQVRDAAGKLGPDLSEIVLTEEGDFRGLHEQIERLTTRIEAVVGELQQREREVLR